MHKFSKNKEDAIDLEASTDEEDVNLKNPSSIANIVRNAKKRKIVEKTSIFKSETSMEPSIPTQSISESRSELTSSLELEIRLSQAVSWHTSQDPWSHTGTSGPRFEDAEG